MLLEPALGTLTRRPSPGCSADAEPDAYHQQPMAVLIASDLHKDMAGQPLLRGVSFKLERRTRMTIAGRNGAGKTTLLRMLSGEESIDRGELSLAKGARVMLHDQRPPRERGRPLREYVLSGWVEELALEADLAELERRMGEGASDEALLARYSRAQARLEARGGYLWPGCGRAAARGGGGGGGGAERMPAAAVSTRSPAASSRAPRLPARSPPPRMFCCSTSRRTTSTSSLW